MNRLKSDMLGIVEAENCMCVLCVCVYIHIDIDIFKDKIVSPKEEQKIREIKIKK